MRHAAPNQARIAKDLKDLRDQSVFAFFMMNALFVLIVFLLQLNKDLLHIKWPFGIKTNVTYDHTTMEVKLAPSAPRILDHGFISSKTLTTNLNLSFACTNLRGKNKEKEKRKTN